MDFNYEIINEQFENNKVWVVILKVMVEFDPNPNLKIFDLTNNKFDSIPNFQMKSSFPNRT